MTATSFDMGLGDPSTRQFYTHYRRAAPVRPIRRWSELNERDVLLQRGTAFTVAGPPELETRQVGDGRLKVTLIIPAAPPPPGLPTHEHWATKTTGSVYSRWTTTRDEETIKIDDLPTLPPPGAHPLDGCVVLPGCHLPTCCGVAWPCPGETERWHRAQQADQENRNRRSCANPDCWNWIYSHGGHIQFGDGRIELVDRDTHNPLPAFQGLKVVELGDTHTQYKSNPDIVRFCRRSKCVTAARRFGEENGCPIPGTRKALEAELRNGGKVLISWYSPRSMLAEPVQAETATGLRLVD